MHAFILMYHPGRAGGIQVPAMVTGRPPRLSPREVCEDAARRDWTWYRGDLFGPLDWDALVRRRDAAEPSHRS